MRWLLTLGLLTLAAPAYAGDKEAEKLFRQMEKKIAEAKTVQVRYEINLDILGTKADFRGIAVLGEGDKFHFTANGTLGPQKVNVKAISTGTKTYAMELEKNDTKIEDCPKGLGTYLRAVLPRVGLFSGMNEFGKKTGDLTNAADAFKMSDFKLGAKEKVGGVETQIVEYRVQLKGMENAVVKQYINTQTGLPAKMEMRSEQGGLGVGVTETYSDFTLNGKVDPKLFEAPK